MGDRDPVPMPMADPADYIPQHITQAGHPVRNVGPWPWFFGLDLYEGLARGRWIFAARDAIRWRFWR